MQPAPSPSVDTRVHAVTRPVAAGSASDSLFDSWGVQGTVVVAVVDQVKDLKSSDLLHVTLLSTNNHTTIKSTQSDLALPPKT